MSGSLFEDRAGGLRFDADFATGSSGPVRLLADGRYEAQPQEEPVEAWFTAALEEHFGGAGVPREYACNLRIKAERDRQVDLRFCFTQTNGKNYMAPPYWIYRRDCWRPLPAAATVYVPGEYVDVRFSVAAGEEVRVANKPFYAPAEIGRQMEDLAGLSPLFQLRQYGSTHGGRPLLALETEARPETIVVGATLQPAEPAARPVLAVAHWLTDRSALSQRLLERFRFCFVPLGNPDGAAAGHSVTNGLGEVPMFSFGHLLEGRPAPLETRHLWTYMEAVEPTAYIEFHTHYQDNHLHKLNNMAAAWFTPEKRPLAERVDQRLLTLNSQWRVTPLEPTTPLVQCGKFAHLAARLQALAYCYQIYAVTQEATASHAVNAVAALAQGLAGPEWAAVEMVPHLVPG
ncbi:MAG: hypothetical protein GKR89_08850 [Candidatus Latescibacteria bacterium]|nr:hypothetical protein [Candidatus Latescibacterota bacterium]